MLKWIQRFFSKNMIVEDPKKVKTWQDWLNKYFGTGWVPVNGFNTITRLSFDINGNAIFDANSGYPLKAFVNTVTGEVRTFDARKFYVGQ